MLLGFDFVMYYTIFENCIMIPLVFWCKNDTRKLKQYFRQKSEIKLLWFRVPFFFFYITVYLCPVYNPKREKYVVGRLNKNEKGKIKSGSNKT